jgi:hypothetical protein
MGGRPETVDANIGLDNASGPWAKTGLGKARSVEAATGGNFNMGKAMNGVCRQGRLLDGLLGTSVQVE